MKKTFVIGDVHGCYHTLLKLIDKLPQKAKLIFVGDLCDRGKFSKEVIEYVMQNNHLCVKGNHEDFMHRYIEKAIFKNDKSSKWVTNKGWGGRETIHSYLDDNKMLAKHLKWINKLPLYIQIKDRFVTHGFGLPYYKRKDSKQNDETTAQPQRPLQS